jgi:hypothetical protein
MATYILNDAKMFSDIADGIAIAINSETGIYYGMNNFGTAVFENILDGASSEDILAAIKGMPEAPADVEANLSTFIEKLKKFEIILEGRGNGTVTLEPDIAKRDEFILTVQEYSDAQELLLADPIHEVKNETGWQPDKAALETDEAVVKGKEAKINPDQGQQ